ncbi:Sodium/potassium-transporting ATPase subunit beta-1-interacting protein [Sergentomyia squamirostris]
MLHSQIFNFSFSQTECETHETSQGLCVRQSCIRWSILSPSPGNNSSEIMIATTTNERAVKLTIIERQVMDFLGYMWAPILVNFFHIIFVIFGFFGAYQFRPKYILTYSVWNFLWIGWNVFLVCFYLNVGSLDRESDVLNLGTGTFSWFVINGYGCKPVYPVNITSEDPFRPIRPERVDDCVLEYHTVEVIHSSLQIILAILGIIGAITIGKIFIDEDDDRFDFMGGDAKSPQHTVVHPMYVSYTSLPTSGTLSKGTTDTPRRGFTMTTVADDGKTSLSSLEMRPHIKYTELSTEHLMVAENGAQFAELDDLEEEMRDYYAVGNLATIEKGGRSRRAVFEAPSKDYDPPKIYRAHALPPPPPQLASMAPASPDFEPYRMPVVNHMSSTRSPHLKTRRRPERQHYIPANNYCDQIRDAPPGYFFPSSANGEAIQRAKSHDRLSHRSRRSSQGSRPRSFCSNN